jgi:hypothetical protein
LAVLHLGLDWYDDFAGIVVHSGHAGAAQDHRPAAWSTTPPKRS